MQCNTQHSTKIQEALLLKIRNPKLNTQLYANGSFLLNKFLLVYLLTYVGVMWKLQLTK